MPHEPPAPSDRPSPELAERPTTLGGLVWSALVLATTFVAALVATGPPAPLEDDAPTDVFSAARALERAHYVLGEQLPHPVGTEEHGRVRERLVAALRELGLEPEIQRTVARGPEHTFALVQNIVARVRGRGTGPAVLATAHYDSVWAGPGAADDGAGVASLLEIARLLTSGPPPARDVIFLFSDGEESGLVGATVFAEEHPWFEEVAAVVNLEMRGSAGRALLFETGPNSGPLLAQFARRVARPATNSLAAEVYRRMPNDTDFTVYRERGLPGANLAAIGAAGGYHRPLDRLEHLDPGTLQHLGDQGAALVRTLAEEPLPVEGDGERVYTDVLGRVLLGWPTGWNLPLTLATWLLAFLTITRLRGRGAVTWSRILTGGVTLVLTLGLAAAAGVAWVSVLRELSGHELPWKADPVPTRVGFAAAVLFTTLVAARTVGRRAGFWGVWCAGLLAAGLAGLVCVVLAPGASFYFLVPGLVGGLLPQVSTAMRSPLEGRSREIALALTLAAACVLWLPIWVEVELALGTGAGLVHTAQLGFIGVLLAPLIAAASSASSRALGTATLLALAGSGLWAAAGEPFDARTPQVLNLVYLADGDTDESRFAWWSPQDDAPDGARAGLGDGATNTALWDWLPRPMPVPLAYRDEARATEGLVVRAPVWGALAPVVELERNEPADNSESGRRVRARLRSLRGALGLHLCLPDGAHIEEVTIGERTWTDFEPEVDADEELPPELSFFGIDDRAVDVQWRQPSDAPFVAFDSDPALPPAAAQPLDARGPAAAPGWWGDLSLLYRRVELR